MTMSREVPLPQHGDMESAGFVVSFQRERISWASFNILQQLFGNIWKFMLQRILLWWPWLIDCSAVGNPTPGGIMQPPDIPDIIGLGCDRTPIESAAQKCSNSKRRATFRIFGNENLHESFWRWDEEFSLRFSPSDPPCLGWSGTRTIGQRFVSWPFYILRLIILLDSSQWIEPPLVSHCKGNTFKILQVKFDKNIDKNRHCHSHYHNQYVKIWSKSVKVISNLKNLVGFLWISHMLWPSCGIACCDMEATRPWPPRVPWGPGPWGPWGPWDWPQKPDPTGMGSIPTCSKYQNETKMISES